MIWLYGAVDDSEAAVSIFDERECRSIVVLDAGGVIPCVGKQGDNFDRCPSERALRDHDRVVQRLMSACTVAPFRFDTVVDGSEEFHGALDPRAPELSELLGWLHGRIELAVRARSTGREADLPDQSGRSYLRARRAGGIPGQLVELHHILLSRAVAATASGDGRNGFKGSYLVERGDMEDFCVEAKTAAEDIEGVTDLSVTGPWAPYSFVTTAWSEGPTDPRRHGNGGKP